MIGRLLLTLLLTGGACFSASAQNVLFDIAQRKAELQRLEFAVARTYCLAEKEKWDGTLPQPIDGLRSTKDYGSDNRPEAFTWPVMLLGGRALAGEERAVSELRRVLLIWADADAFGQSEITHDTFYALKRYMLPIVVNYAIVAEGMPASDRRRIEQWIDRIVRPLDRKFDGDVDHNNHRALADSVLMAWGSFTGEDALYAKGIHGYRRLLAEARPDGGLPLETRRGARALWYQRHAISSMVLMAEISRIQGDDLYEEQKESVSLETLVHYLLNGQGAPLRILSDAAENYIPGPEDNFLDQDTAFLRRRDHGRHYMAFAEAYVHRDNFAAQRLQVLMRKTGFRERPLIDEYFGGNATCFFWRPEHK